MLGRPVTVLLPPRSKRAFDNVDVQLDKWIDHAHLAARIGAAGVDHLGPLAKLTFNAAPIAVCDTG
jgi:hypothetical protein